MKEAEFLFCLFVLYCIQIDHGVWLSAGRRQQRGV